MSSELTAIRDHWNQRASLGVTAGTQDLLLKRFEQRALLNEIGALPSPTMAMEVGCGRGELAKLIVDTYPQIDLLAVDAAEEMIAAARSYYAHARLRFKVADVFSLPGGRFDLILTERMLINLPTWDEQHAALEAFADRLVPGGRYLMCEHSQDGLDAINHSRHAVGLCHIQHPWHNRYLRASELAQVTCLRLVRCLPFSSTYYFLSRVVNAKLATLEGQEPAYDAPINQFAWMLPSEGPWAQGRLWVWEKA